MSAVREVWGTWCQDGIGKYVVEFDAGTFIESGETFFVEFREDGRVRMEVTPNE